MSIIEKTLHATMTVGKESILKSFSVRKICRRTGKLYCAEFRECVYCSLLKEVLRILTTAPPHIPWERYTMLFSTLSWKDMLSLKNHQNELLPIKNNEDKNVNKH